MPSLTLSSLLALTPSEVQRIYFFEISLSLLHHFLMIALKMNNIAARSSPAVPRSPPVRPCGGGAVVVVFDITYVLLSLQPPPPPLLVLLE